MAGDVGAHIRNVTAVLGPTNTGKTHLAIERMLGHESGMIGLPLRLLAREVYDKIGKRIGFDKVALVTGEEKIKPQNARYWVATVEAMPRDIDVAFLAIDEVQLAADPDRGHVFTERLLNARGTEETLLLGAQTMRGVISELIPGANFISRPRLSKLTYAGQKKITRLPKRTAIVAFSANEVYSLAELIRRQCGGAAVVLGALSPRTRNAQVGLYQSGEVDYLVATDAIGMGLNLDVDHVAFAGMHKFDGRQHRELNASELAQIAGRAGRHLNDGTFGVTGSVSPLDSGMIERLEEHNFDPVRVVQWRNSALDFSSVDGLKISLRMPSNVPRGVRARDADDVEVLDLVARDEDVAALALNPAAVARLWDVCQVPDYRKISLSEHGELVARLYKDIMGSSGRIDEDWFSKQVAFSDKTDGDIDTLSNRIAHIRTWTYVSNRSDWLGDPEHWQGRTREIEELLSDALHERLTQRFVDRRTSALMKGMRDKEELAAEIGEDGTVNVEGHFVGRLSGLLFAPDVEADGIHGKATRSAAAPVLASEFSMRVRRIVAAKDDAFKLSRCGEILWRDMAIGRIEVSDDLLKPTVVVVADEDHVAAADREKIRERLETWIKDLVFARLKPLVDLAESGEISGLARGIAFQLVESFGILKRESVSNEVKALDQPARGQLRKYGVRFGAFNIYIPILLKPAAAELAATLWVVKYASEHGLKLDDLPEPPRAGLTSAAVVAETPEAFYRAFGYQVCGPRVVRIDILERLADQIRPLLAWRRKDGSTDTPPSGSTGDGGFKATPEMMSILGCSPSELGHVLGVLGFSSEQRPVKVDAVKADGVKTDAAKPDDKKEEVAKVAGDEASDGDGGNSSSVSVDADAKPETPGTQTAASSDEPASAGTSADVSADVASAETGEDKAVLAAVAQDAKNESPESADASNAPAADADGSEETAASDAVEYEEIWRPKPRRGREDRPARRKGGRPTRRTQGGQQSGAEAGKDGAGQERRSESRQGKRRDSGGKGKGPGGATRRGGGGPKRGRDGDRSAQRFQSKSSGKRKALDPDSPFAALAGLREELAKPEAKPDTAKD